MSEMPTLDRPWLMLGDCLERMAEIPDGSVDLVFTSPPYADQRKAQYGGIPECDYPAFTVRWMSECRRLLKPSGSVAINIRPHLRHGQISDYTLKTRLALRSDGWKECEEFIWHKPDSAPLGRVDRPRRSWESVHWFSLTGSPYCSPKENGTFSNRIGFSPGRKGLGQFIHVTDRTKKIGYGISRVQDVVSISVSSNGKDDENGHPARFPIGLPQWFLPMLCPLGGLVLDPFTGSATTGVACFNTERRFIGIEKHEPYFDIGRRRIEQAITVANQPAPLGGLFDAREAAE